MTHRGGATSSFPPCRPIKCVRFEVNISKCVVCADPVIPHPPSHKRKPIDAYSEKRSKIIRSRSDQTKLKSGLFDSVSQSNVDSLAHFRAMSDAAVQVPLPSDSEIRATNRGYVPIRLRQSLSNIPLETLQETAAISREVIDDVIHWSVGRGSRNPPNEYAKTMRSMVEKVLDKHSSLFRGLLSRVEELDSSTTIISTAYHEFSDGEANWGRITVLCAFASRLARHFQENHMEDDVEVLAGTLRSFFNDHLDKWIATQGGWNQFTSRYQRDSSLEPTIFKGMLATGLVLGVLAGMVALR